MPRTAASWSKSPGIGRKPIDAGEEQPVQRGWNVHRFAVARARPPIALAHEHSRAHQASDDLLNEQRIATGSRRDEMLDPRESRPVDMAEQSGHERLNRNRGERGEPDDALERSRQW